MCKKVFWRCIVMVLSCSASAFTCIVLLKCTDVMAYEIQNTPSLPLYDEIVFPHTMTTSGIVLERLVCYEGPFLEDNSNEEVSNIAGLILRNHGSQTVSYAKIQLFIENEPYIFEVWDVPIDASVLVLEGSKGQYKQTSKALASVHVNWTDLHLPCSEVHISEQGMGTLRITNTGTNVLENLVLYHKGYESSCSLLLGGKTYQTKCPNLSPGETAIVSPEHYAHGYSRVLWILEYPESSTDTSIIAKSAQKSLRTFLHKIACMLLNPVLD